MVLSQMVFTRPLDFVIQMDPPWLAQGSERFQGPQLDRRPEVTRRLPKRREQPMHERFEYKFSTARERSPGEPRALHMLRIGLASNWCPTVNSGTKQESQLWTPNWIRFYIYELVPLTLRHDVCLMLEGIATTPHARLFLTSADCWGDAVAACMFACAQCNTKPIPEVIFADLARALQHTL